MAAAMTDKELMEYYRDRFRDASEENAALRQRVDELESFIRCAQWQLEAQESPKRGWWTLKWPPR